MTGNKFNEYNHRLGLSDECPQCRARFDSMKWLLFYISHENCGDVYYTGAPKIRVASTCPACGVESWAHFPEDTREVIAKLINP